MKVGRTWRRAYLPLALLLPMIWLIAQRPLTVHGQTEAYLISGRLTDPQGRPVSEAEVRPNASREGEALAVAESHKDGSWSLRIHFVPELGQTLSIERAHFHSAEHILEAEAVDQLRRSGTYDLGDMTLERKITAGFWAAGLIFLGILLVIATERLHSTTAALAGMSVVFLISLVGGAINPAYYIFDLERALTYINWEVIFLVLGMMIIIAVIEGTGIFQWTAFQAYRLSRGRAWLLVLILMGVTGVASALLDNFTTMLLMTPISLQIGLAMGINPLALIIPEVLASNVAGISTLIGTPTNILIGAYAGISFSDFLVNQTLGVLLAMSLRAGFVLFFFRHEWRKQAEGISPRLYDRLQKNATLQDPVGLWKSGIVFMLVLVGFVAGERHHIAPAVPALIGATILLIWLNPDIHHMIRSVDWTTLVFFISIFIVIGAIQEVGIVSLLAGAMADLIGGNLTLGIFVLVFGVGTLSVAIANIPLAASMLPIVEFLSSSIPGAGSKVLYYALSMGAAMGGNGFLIGCEANLVTAGISEQAGTPISFGEFMRIGLPVTYLTLSAGFLWLLLRFVVFGS